MIALACLVASAWALERPAPLPEALPSTPWELPAADVRTLSNGMQVHIATNRELPLWEVRLVLRLGEFVDPAGKEGLAVATLDMMNEGAGDLDAAAFSRALQRLAGSVDTSANGDTAVVSASGIRRNIEPVLDLWASALLAPAFAGADWDRVRKLRTQDLALAQDDPSDVARAVWGRLVWGDGYLGRDPSPETLAAIEVADMVATHGRYIGPDNAVIVVGGDVDADEILPLLEARIGTWAPEGIERTEPDPTQLPVAAETIYFVDNPGASQSVLRSGHTLPDRLDPGHFARKVANQPFGRAFTGRLNMNLREDKGYTYGARCFDVHWEDLGQFICSSSVRSDVTGASLVEMRTELQGVLGDRPLTDDEIATARASLIQGYPGNFETTDTLLDEVVDIWLYGLPSDWITRYIDEIDAVDPETANASLRNAIFTESTFWLVVGDKSVVWASLEGIGLPIVELDRRGRPVEQAGP